MVTKYFVCYGNSPGALQENVNKAIENGWQPIGGVAVSLKWLSGEARNVIEESMLSQAVVWVTTDVLRDALSDPASEAARSRQEQTRTKADIERPERHPFRSGGARPNLSRQS
jgi:hypothetical protein